ncbi:IPExxxVDY family protein [Paenimyroides aestuarii]|uniref:IPExxxVDY family protein n=1 Tax=Paenimyroides aestuarii TaxID=2968490 RepID=A0ABY5NUB4_9FLAO|nr:IPExxxVDY family protein [Paenimyroides aestuarii]UUV22125.1 IPExxxVDY family protein [Paenimyroides aestuarii]
MVKKNTNEILHKLDFIDDADDETILIALKSNIPDYKMAYLLNRHLSVRFEKATDDISLTTDTGVAYFRTFAFQDTKNHLVWRLLENKSNHSENITEQPYSLFTNENTLFTATNYLVNEWKNIDFFILIENADLFFNPEELLEKLQDIKNLSTHFLVDWDSLSIKTQKNLIF